MSMNSNKRSIRAFVLLSLATAFCSLPNDAIGQNDNGISVGQPKVFDNRTLTIMLESLSETLRSMQFVDQSSLKAAFGLLQGSRSSEVVSNLSVNTLPIPGLKTENISKTGNVS